MSSTGRGTTRNEFDWYPTPWWCVRRFMEVVHLEGTNWLEPSAGEGAIIEGTEDYRKDVLWNAVELRSEALKALTGALAPSWERNGSGRLWCPQNFLKIKSVYPEPDVVISNPPFGLAAQFIEHAFNLTQRYVVMLLRVNYWGSEERHAFMSTNPPDTYVLPNRAGFTADGKTDSIEYGWFVWDKTVKRECGKIRVLGLTSKNERERDRLTQHKLRAPLPGFEDKRGP
jgi:hypothetical protein